LGEGEHRSVGALYKALAINTSGDIFVGADFINGTGGVFRSIDNGESWVEVNGGVISTDVRALAINASGHIFAGAYPDGGVFRSTDNGATWTPVDNGLTCKNVYSLAVNSAGDIFVGTAGCGTGVYRSTDNGDHWTLVNNGLTSTDVPALAINADGHIFAGTQSQFGEGGGMFRSIDNGDTWTEQDTALPRSMLTRWPSIPPGIFSPAPRAGLSSRPTMATIGVISVADWFRSAETSGLWRSLRITIRLPELQAAEFSAVLSRPQRARSRQRIGGVIYRLGR
jgi:hypothetical protein